MYIVVAIFTALSLVWPFSATAFPYRNQSILGLFLFSIIPLIKLYKQKKIYSFIAGWFVFMCYVQAVNPVLYMSELAPTMLSKFQANAIESWFVLVLCIIAYTYGVQFKVNYTKLLSYCFLFGIIVLIGHSILGTTQSVWFFNPGGAQDAAFCGVLYPFLWSYCYGRNYKLLIAGTLAYVVMLFYCWSDVAFLIAALNAAFILFGRKTFIACLSVFPAFWLLKDHFNDNGRLNIWENFFKMWLSWGDQVFYLGSGAASFSFYNIARQQLIGEKHLFLWAHNDFIQVLFEYGVFGLALMVMMLMLLSWRLRHLKAEFTSLWCLAVMALFNMPIHHITSIGLLIYLAIRGEVGRVDREDEACILPKPQ